MESVVVSEMLLEPDYAARFWPGNLPDEMRKQSERRNLLLSRFQDMAGCLPRPDMPIESAIEAGHISERQAERFYDSLSDLLDEPEYGRIVLYLPFELLPGKSWCPDSGGLASALERFKQAYMTRWKDLLWMEDVRANFVDGDVLEVEKRIGDLPRVVKAAHLIPKLVEKGWMTIEEVNFLKEQNDSEMLIAGIDDALAVLGDLKNAEAENGHEGLTKGMALEEIKERLAEEFSRIDAEEYCDMTERREKWLRQSEKEKVIDVLAENVSRGMIEESISYESMEKFLEVEIDGKEVAVGAIQVLIEGIRKAIESLSMAGSDKASDVYERYRVALLRLWESDRDCLKETLSKFFRHLYHLGIVDDRQLARMDIALPELGGRFSENLASINREIDLQAIAGQIASDPELSAIIYPVVLVFGSLLKGYGTKDSDIDVGIFVRPALLSQDRTKLPELLKKVFPEKVYEEGIVQFYLEENGNVLQVRDSDANDLSMGKVYWKNVLFGSAWIGDEKTIRDLFGKLLVPCMHGTDRIIHGMDARSRFLGHLERDNLQYRLMHKGYEKFYPPLGGIKTKNAHRVDGKSKFWDSGYRMLATELFIRRVFLPKILAPKI